MSERATCREFDAAAIVAAYRQTEIIPVRGTWQLYEARVDPATNNFRLVPCGCGLVALARAAGIDPGMIFDPCGGVLPLGEGVCDRYARALGCDPEHARGIEEGWDADTGRLEEDTPYARGFRAGWDASEEVLR